MTATMTPTDATYPIKPNMIDASGHIWAAFGHMETEVSARWIVRFCQERGGDNWRPFTYAEIDGFCKKNGVHDGFTFNRLLAEGRRSRPFVHFTPSDVIMGDTREVAPLPGEGRDGLLVEKDGLYHITHQFVARCFQSSPKKDG